MKKAMLAALIAASAGAVCAFGLGACTQKEDAAHTHDWGGWTLTTEPTETAEGKATRACANDGCDAEDADKEYILPALTSADYTVSEKPATCSAEGVVSYTYNKDGVSVSFDVATPVDPHAHDYGVWIEKTFTCEKDGLKGHYHCSLCGKDFDGEYAEISDLAAAACGHDWGEWTLAVKPTAETEGKAVRVCANGGCDADDEQKEYVLPVLGSGDYAVGSVVEPTLESEGSAEYSYDKDGVKLDFTVLYQIYTVNLTGNSQGVTVALGTYTAAAENGVAHIKAEKQDWRAVVSKEGSYSYTAAEITADNPVADVTLPTQISGGSTSGSPKKVGAGLYFTLITTAKDSEREDMYAWRERYFSISAEEAKNYTVKVMNDDTAISPDESGYDIISTVWESYSIVLEEGDSTGFGIGPVQTSEKLDAFSRAFVVFVITESEAPEKGDQSRPVRLVNVDGEAVASEEVAVENSKQKVWFRLDNSFANHATVTFDGLTEVYYAGFNRNGEGNRIESGAVVSVGSYQGVYTYLYAYSAGGSCSITAQIYYAEGEKSNPIEATAGAANKVELNVTDGILEQWYKLQTAESGTYIIKPDSASARLEIYDNVYGAVKTYAEYGAAVAVALTADTPVYIRAADTLNEPYSFTVAPFSSADAGTAKAQPLEIISAGEYNAYKTEHYYTYTPSANSYITLSFNGGVQNYENCCYFDVYSDAEYSEGVASSLLTNKTAFYAVAEQSYYIKVVLEATAASDKFAFGVQPLEAHDYVITVTDGTNTYDGVTVTLVNGGNDVASAVTADGKASFANMPNENYTVRLTNLPEGYGYYAHNAVIGFNRDEVTEFTVTLTALVQFSVTVTLPDGSPAAGVSVYLSNDVAGGSSAQTDENGVAVIMALPPLSVDSSGKYQPATYSVDFGFPESFGGDYACEGSVRVSVAAPAASAALTKLVTYNISLVGSDGAPLGEGIEVSLMKGSSVAATAVTDANGQVTVKTFPAAYDIALGGDYSTTAKTTAEGGSITATCYENIIFGASTSSTAKNSKTLSEGVNAIDNTSGTYFKFAPTAGGKYKIEFTDDTAVGLHTTSISYMGTDSSRLTTIYNTRNGNSYPSILSVSSDGTYFTITLAEGEYIAFNATSTPSTEKGVGAITVTQV